MRTVEYVPRHRKPGPAVEEPVLQPAPRHRDDIVARVGAAVFDLDELMGCLRVPSHVRELGRLS